MKKSFPGYYALSKDQLDKIWSKAVLVLDTNVLLDFYRVSPETQADLLTVVKYYAEHKRLWIPYQVAKEYHENLYAVIFDQVKKFDDTLGFLKSFLSSISQKRNHPFLNDRLINRITDLANDLEGYFEDQKQKLKDSVGDATLKDHVADIFCGCIGQAYSELQLKEIYKEGKIRYNSNVPPGYEDRKKGEPDMYKDLIIWKQVIDFAKDKGLPVFFVSSDTKADWYLINRGQTICPHPALVKEFSDTTAQMILFFSLERFLTMTKAHNVVKIQEESINEVKIKEEKYSENKTFDTVSFFSHHIAKEEIAKMAAEIGEVYRHRLTKMKSSSSVLSDEIGSTSSNSDDVNNDNSQES